MDTDSGSAIISAVMEELATVLVSVLLVVVGVAGLMTSCFSFFFPQRLGDVMAAEGLSRVEALGAVTLGIVSFPFDVFFPLVVRVETRGGTASLAFPLSCAASRGGMMSEMNAVVGACVCLMIYVEKKDMWLRVCACDGFGCMRVLVIELAACMYW
jgi:hypothetical protein